jgi:hypothetical protein
LKSKAPKEIICFLFLWTILPLGFIWIISQKVPIYMDRFFIFCLPPAILLVSVGIISIRSRISTFCTAVLFIIMACAIIRIYIPAEAFQKEDWKRSAEYLHLSVQQEDLLIFRVYQEIIPYHYYGLLDLPWTALETNRIIALPEKEKSHQRIYIVYWEISSSVHAFGAKETHMEEESNAAIRQWISENLVITERITRYKGLIIIVGKLKYQ